jgi:glycosyltransferase involved in cell wall biosynthesis
LHFGRFDPSKNIPGIIQSCLEIRSKGIDLEFLQVGRSSNKKYEKLSSEITESYSNLAWINFSDSVVRSELPSILDDAYAFIHNFQGSLDKTLIEATMHAVPVLTVNLEYLQIFGSWGDLKDLTLSSEFWALYNLPQVEIYSELQRRRELAIGAHSLDHWTRSLIQILGIST